MTEHPKRGLRSAIIDFPARGFLQLILLVCLCLALGACGDDNDGQGPNPTNTTGPVATATPANTPAATDTAMAVDTPTATATPEETPIPEPTIDFLCQGPGRCVVGGMSTDKTCLSEDDCDVEAGESCGALGTCNGGTNPGGECAANGDCGQGGSCVRTSRLDLESSLATLPLGLVGSLAFHCDEPGSDGNRACTCEIQQFAPIQIAGIGFVCISAGDAQCEPGFLNCDGGSAADVTIVADGKIGTCTDNVDCASQCDSYCAGKSMHQIQSGCTGYCAGGERDDMPCDCDLIPAQGCPADGLDCPDGQCNGPDPATAGTCQCQCVDTMIRRARRPRNDHLQSADRNRRRESGPVRRRRRGDQRREPVPSSDQREDLLRDSQCQQPDHGIPLRLCGRSERRQEVLERGQLPGRHLRSGADRSDGRTGGMLRPDERQGDQPAVARSRQLLRLVTGGSDQRPVHQLRVTFSF